MTTPGLITLLILLSIGALVFIDIAGMPGRDARERNHPAADAISLLGWLGLAFGGVGWVVAMIWARLPPLQAVVAQARNDEAPGA